jgi:hypothetical protein
MLIGEMREKNVLMYKGKPTQECSARCEVLTAVLLKIQFFWDVALCLASKQWDLTNDTA